MAEFALPEGWVRSLIKEISLVSSGIGFPKEYQGNPTGDFAFVKVGDISRAVLKNNGFINYADHYVSLEIAKKLKGTPLRPGSTIFAKIGEAIHLNRRAYVKKSILIDNNVMAVKSFIDQSDRYIYYYLQTIKFSDQSRSTTVPSLRKGDVEEINIPLPPLAEQHEIAARLDTLLAQVDATKARLDGIPALLKRFRQSVLAAAVSGKLTEGWRKEQKKSQRPFNLSITFDIEDFGHDLFDVPDNWQWTALGNYAKCSRGRFSIRPRNDPTCFGGSYPFIQIGDLPKNGGYISSYHQTLNDKGFAVSKMFSEGTIVIAIVGATIGNTGILNQKMCFPDSLVGIETNNPISNKFIDYYLRSEKQKIRTISYAGGGQPNIKLETLNQYPFPLPPLEEQTQIVARVEALFAFADLIEARVKAAQAQVNMLTQAILAKAFRGELTAAWRAQHPELISGENSAEALLARIQAERGQSEKPAKKAGKKTGAARKPKSAAPAEPVADELPAGQLNLPGLLLPEAVEAGR